MSLTWLMGIQLSLYENVFKNCLFRDVLLSCGIYSNKNCISVLLIVSSHKFGKQRQQKQDFIRLLLLKNR